MGGWVGPRVGLGVLWKRKLSTSLPRFQPQTFRPVGSRYTDHAIPGPTLLNEPEDESLNTIYTNVRFVTISPSRCSLAIGIESTTPNILVSIRSITPYIMASTDSVTHYTLVSLQQFYVLPTQFTYVLCESGNKQRLFPYTALADWFL